MSSLKSPASRKRPPSKQRSITSFFSSTPRSSNANANNNNNNNNTTPKRASSLSSSAKKTPGTSQTAASITPSSVTRQQNAQQQQQQQQQQKNLRRTLFISDADEEPQVMRKRRRLITTSDDEEEEEKDDNIVMNDADKTKVKQDEDENEDDEPIATFASTRKRTPKSISKTQPKQRQPDVFNLTTNNMSDIPSNISEQQEDTISSDPASSSATNPSFNFDSLCRHQSSSTNNTNKTVHQQVPTALQSRRRRTHKLLSELSNVPQVGQEVDGWCSKHPWTVDIRDFSMRRPSDPDYDPTKLYIPSEELSNAKGAKSMTAFQKQYWRVKMQNYDVIMFLKKGKFYELYDVDADVGHTALGLNYTKGGRVDMRCCGVPEQAVEKHTARLLELGYKVGRIEQVETANAMEKRKNGTTFGGSGSGNGGGSTVCERSLVRIDTKGTVRDDTLLRDHRSRFVIAIAQAPNTTSNSNNVSSLSSSSTCETFCDDENPRGSSSGIKKSETIGLCFIDVASGSINVSQFQDDDCLVWTERLITCLAPHEIIIDSTTLCGPRLMNIVKWCGRKFQSDIVDMGRSHGRDGFKRVSETTLSSYLIHTVQNKESEQLMSRLNVYMKNYDISCRAFGGLVAYLKSLVIDKETLSLANYTLFPDPDQIPNEPKLQQEKNDTNNNMKMMDQMLLSNSDNEDRLFMDASALQNLEVLTSTMGCENGSLLSFIDRASTPAGRRLLRKWISEPLSSSNVIEDRLQAIEDLHSVEDLDGGRLISRICKLLISKKDLERALPKLHQFATVSNNVNVVMFDDTNRRRVRDFTHVLRSVQDCLRGLETLAEALEEIKTTSKKSSRLHWLVTSGLGVPEEALDKLGYFLGEAFDVSSAENNGEIIPMSGAVPSYDKARHELQRVDKLLDNELEHWKHIMKDRTIKYYHRGKEPFQLEVKREILKNRTPDEFEVVSESKTTQRFYTQRIRMLVKQRVNANEIFETESSLIARHMAMKFDQHFSTWFAVSKAAAEVDALIGLARTSRGVDMCRPVILSNNYPYPVFHAQGLKHPILLNNNNNEGEFIANDIHLGDDKNKEGTDVMILTGPNAGGKSTLSRQVGLAVILAQIGCYVPATSLTLRPFKEIFVRMGANDEISRGRSTFMVEMEEVSTMINGASDRSLIIADEVGRGTSTHDGHAIACAVVQRIMKENRSLTIFSTHYSRLAFDLMQEKEMMSMSRCGVYEMAAMVDEKKKSITFLYKLTKGSSCHSRGIYCARVAGINGNIADMAEEYAQQLDRKMRTRVIVKRMTGLERNVGNNDESEQLKKLLISN